MLLVLLIISLLVVGCDREAAAPAQMLREGSAPTAVVCPGPMQAGACLVYFTSETAPARIVMRRPTGSEPREGEGLLVVMQSPKMVKIEWDATAFSMTSGAPWPTKMGGSPTRYDYFQLIWNQALKRYLFAGTMLPPLD